MLYRHCLSPRWVCRERETHTYNKARWWLWSSSDLIKGALWLARTLDYKTDFVWSANMYLEGGAAPDNMILSSVQGAHSNLHCRIDFYTVEAGHSEGLRSLQDCFIICGVCYEKLLIWSIHVTLLRYIRSAGYNEVTKHWFIISEVLHNPLSNIGRLTVIRYCFRNSGNGEQ